MKCVKRGMCKVMVCISIFLLLGGATDAMGDWPCWRGANRDGRSTDTGLLKQWPDGGPRLIWQANGLGKGFSTVSVVGDTVYTTGDVDDQLFVFAFGMGGSERWKTAVDKAWTRSHAGSRSTPSIDENRLYVLSGNGVLVCLDAGSGVKQWSQNLRSFGGGPGGWGYAESPLVYGEMVVAKPGGENFVMAFRKSDGEPVWRSEGFKAGPEYSSCFPFVHDQVPMIATGSRAGIVCVSPKDGTVLWSNDWCAGNTANCPDPVYTDGHVFWANGYGKGGICLELNTAAAGVTAQEAWTTKDMVCHHGGYIIHEGHIYGNHNGGWSCLELKTGEVKWHEKGPGKGSLCWADDMLYLFGERGGKAALATCSPEGMEITGTVTVEGSGPSWAHPVVTGGRLYLRYADNLYCFDVKK